MTALFVMPYYSNDDNEDIFHLKEAINSVISQSDNNWNLIIIDDCSRNKIAHDYLNSLNGSENGKIHVIFNENNIGPGMCRNKGIDYAKLKGIPIILFLDADDIAHKLRLEVCRNILENFPEVSVVYSSFSVIDEFSIPVEMSSLSPSIIEIIESHQDRPPQGPNAWIQIATQTGYTNLTSSTTVRTDLAAKYPFPSERVSEDAHTWLRYSAGGNEFYFTSEIPTLYRIPQRHGASGKGSSSRSRIGLNAFYQAKARVDEDGFECAFNIAVSKGKVLQNSYAQLKANFHMRLAVTLIREGYDELANEHNKRAEILLNSRDRVGMPLK